MRIIFYFISILYRYFYFLYKPLYFIFKKKKDWFEILIVKYFITEGDIVVDIGANIGFFSKIMAMQVGSQGKVFSFEPDLTNFYHLKNTIKNYPNVVPINAAVSSFNGLLKLYHSPLLNVDHRSFPSETHSEFHEVISYKLDDYSEFDSKISFIKIDIQGYEIYAFEGMLNTLKTSSRLFILAELWPWGIKKSGKNLKEYFALLIISDLKYLMIKNQKLISLSDDDIIFMETDTEEVYYNLFAYKSSDEDKVKQFINSNYVF